ncbi:hypothetical protein [Mycobacteroides abscessus]|nr:hypothetical protein [Mycobacteroides abscessus]
MPAPAMRLLDARSSQVRPISFWMLADFLKIDPLALLSEPKPSPPRR